MSNELFNIKCKRNHKSYNDHGMEKKLHEQYAEINNDSMSAIISVIVALISIFVSFGYMFLHTSLEPAKDFGRFVFKKTCSENIDLFSIEILMLTSATAVFAICVIHVLCIYVGFSRRVDQFSAHAIRVKLGFLHELLTNSYNPHGYGYSDFIPGLYRKFIQIFFVLKWVLIGLTLLKVHFVECWCYPVTRISYALFLLVVVATTALTICFYNRKYKVYRELEGEFSWYRIQELKYFKRMECKKCNCCCSATQNGSDANEVCAGCFIARRFPAKKDCSIMYSIEIILMILLVLLVVWLICKMTYCCVF